MRSALNILASKLQFESDEITALMLQSSNRNIARDALLRARNQDRYDYSNSDIESYIDKILGLPKISTHRRSSPTPPPNAGASLFFETQVLEVDLETDDEWLRQDTLEEERLRQERSEQDRLEQLNGDGNDAQEVDDSFQVSERDRRRDTHIALERIIAEGLASIPKGTEDPLGEQDPNSQLQVVGPTPSKVLIKFKILEGECRQYVEEESTVKS
ncbi:hypothetical protein V499_04311 [Pseudogymnoascus sp. VKM F-103]|nr:hypothetical protein V499_04311 [Pseudogymnoascus sp. VKM F-103]